MFKLNCLKIAMAKMASLLFTDANAKVDTEEDGKKVNWEIWFRIKK